MTNIDIYAIAVLEMRASKILESLAQMALANGVKVVEKVITSKFRFHLIAIYALGCFHNFSCTPLLYQNYLEEPQPP
jgi:hypothetical protein